MVRSADCSISDALHLIEGLAAELLADPDAVHTLRRIRHSLDHPRDDDDDVLRDLLRDLLEPGPKGVMDVAVLLAADIVVPRRDPHDLPLIDLTQGGA